MNEEIEWNNFVFRIREHEFEEGTLHIDLIDPRFNEEFPAFYLTIKPLWFRNGEGFEEGDYYQDVMNKETMFPVDTHLSYAAITHDFLLANNEHFHFIRNIYSSSLNGHPQEAWTPSIRSRNFWHRQLQKEIGVEFNGERYKLAINEI